MEDVLKRLLEAEQQAEALVDAAQAERDRIIAGAEAEARAAEAQLEARLPELRAGFLEKARERAEQSIAELTRRAHERQHALRQTAQAREADAVEAALALILDPSRD